MNFNKIGRKFLLGLVSLVVVLSCVKLGASAEGTTGILYLSDERIAGRNKVDGNYEVPTKDGYVFGGWYSDDKGQYPLDEEQANKATTAYAKWVPDYVLSVKAQVNQNALNDDFTGNNRAAIRLLTSVDSLDYTSVGFDVVRGDYKDYTYHLNSKNVFSRVRVVGETAGTYTEETPEGVFGSDSHFFEAVTFKNMPESAVNTELTVTPYWVTLDGTRVEGTYSIKTVNLGRSWVYIDSTANETDGKEYGTCGHPFTKLDSALDAVTWVDGKITVKSGKEIEVPADFIWDGKKVDGNVRNITVTGENGTGALLNLSGVENLHFNDNVVFDNVALKFSSNVYANGYELKIKDTVDSQNGSTTLYGGAKGKKVISTSLEINAGSYASIYGGGHSAGGDVQENTKVVVTGATVYTEKANSALVVGGGRGNNSVGKDTYVTVGQGFNSSVTIQDEYYSQVYGGGKDSGSLVKGNTNVIVKDGAKVNFVYGGGASNTTVNGTCNVALAGGEVYSIWGGARGEGTDAGKNGNATVISVTSGKVADIIGGNGTGMTGNTYVEVLGGTVTRRIYGGCYHNSANGAGYVEGTTTVVIGKGVIFDWSTQSLFAGEKICAGSRYAGEQDEEVGILIFNDGTYDSSDVQGNNADVYDYLVKATEGGKITVANDVVADATMLRVTPDDAATPGTMTSGNTVTYFKGEGVCALPTTDTMDVDFSPLDAQAGLDSCEARIDGIYYDTFVNAVNSAKVRNTKPTVTVMKDCTVNTTINNVVGEEYTIVGDGNTKKVITVNSAVSELFQVRGKLKLENLKFTGGQHIVRNYAGTLTLDNIEMNDIAGVGIYHENGTTYAYNTTISNAVKFGVLVVKGTANIDNVNISGITGTDNRDAINVQGGKLNIYNTKSPYNGVTISNVAQRNGIHVTGGEVYADAVTITDIKTGHGIYVSKGSVEIEQLNVGAEDGAIKNSALYMKGSNQAKAIISNFTASNIEKQVVYLEGNTSAEISNFNLTSSKDTGVRTKETATVILEDGTLTAANGRYGIYADGTSTVTATDVSIVRNVAMPSGVDSLVYVGTGSAITLKEDDGTSMIQGNSELAGKGVLVEGTFNLEGGTITGHKLADTTNMGAGVHVQAGGVFNMSGGTVTGNTAVNGGGVALAGTAANTEDGTAAVLATLNLTGGKITGNNATATESNETTGAGGGVYATYASIIMGGQSTEISGNTGINDGAGVLLSTGSTFLMNNGKITGNTLENGKAARGGGVAIINDGSFTLNNGEVSGNVGRAGGGFILKNSAHLIINGGSIKSNRAIDIGTDKGYGGAIYILNTTAQVTMNAGIIESNASNNDGGSMYMNRGTFNWNGGTFVNQAKGSVTGSGTSNCKANVSSSITDHSIINSSRVSIKVINN